MNTRIFRPSRSMLEAPVCILHIWFWIGVLIVVYALTWYLLNSIAQAFMLTMTASFPEYHNPEVLLFFQNLWTYSPEIVLLAGVLLGVYAEVQRKRAERYLYGY